MTRAPIVIAATVTGMAATLTFDAHRPASTASTAAVSAPSTGTGSRSSGSSSSGSSSKTSSGTTKTVTSDAVSTQYGPVQLKVTVSGGKITKVEALELPSNDPKSVQIGSYAEPLLQQSALSKQDGTVDVVSGATYTSDGYQTALQSALDRAGVRGASASGGTTA